MKKRLIVFKIVTLIFTLIIFGFLFSFKVFLVKSETSKLALKTSIEEEWQVNIESDLKYIRSYLENVVNKNEIDINDSEAISENVLEHLSLQNKQYIKSLDVVNLGYMVNKSNSDLELLTNDVLTDEQKEYLENKCKNTIDPNKDIKNIEKQINEISYDLSKQFNLEKEIVKQIIINSILEKNKILLSTSENNHLEEIIDDIKRSDTFGFKNFVKDDLWIETISVPEGRLGFDNEPKYKNGSENLSYRKIVLIATIDSNIIMKPYNDHIRDIKNLENCIYTLFIFVTMSTTFFACYQFYHMLKKYNSGGDTNAEYFSKHLSSISNSMRRVPYFGVKSICKKFRKRDKEI